MTKAILHVDGDSFFASCETSLNPRLKGKPVVTGQERGIASSMSKEAKALGITRGMPIFKIKKLFPEVIVLSSDYGVYEAFAQRMYTIVERYADKVEEYSIDECFAELESFSVEFAERIKREMQSELGMTFSLGVAPTKVLAKLASSQKKPDGLTILLPEDIDAFLESVDVGKVWGIGPATAQELRGRGVKTALELKNSDGKNLHKNIFGIWRELNGYRVFPIERAGERPKSIQATRTFTPPTNKMTYLLSELSKNTENACVKLRRERLCAKKIYFFLKTQEFRYHRHELTLPAPLSAPSEIMSAIRGALETVWRPGTLYRTTGVTLAGLAPVESAQIDLFGSSLRSDKWDEVFKAVDKVDKRYGSHTLTLTSSLEAYKRRGGAVHKRLNIPYMGEVS